jgi:predicted N-acyltransferase
LPELPHVSVAYRVDDINAADWSLVVSKSNAPVFYGLGYLRSYEAYPVGSFAGGCFLTAYLGGEPVAVLPVFRQPRPDPLGLLPAGAADHPGLLGHVWYCYDTRIPTIATEPSGVYAAMLDRLEELRDELGVPLSGLVNVDASDSVLALARDRGWYVAEADSRYQIRVDGFGDFSDYLAVLGRKSRQNLARHLRRAEEAGARITVVSPDRDNLVEVCELCRHTASKFGNAYFYQPETFVPFVLGLGEQAVVVRVDGPSGLLAGAVSLVDDARFHMWVAGFRHATIDGFSPHYVLWAAEIEEAIVRGLPLVEAGRRNDDFKRRHGATRVPLAVCVSQRKGD